MVDSDAVPALAVGGGSCGCVSALGGPRASVWGSLYSRSLRPIQEKLFPQVCRVYLKGAHPPTPPPQEPGRPLHVAGTSTALRAHPSQVVSLVRQANHHLLWLQLGQE